jgi:hypothetical protein
LRIDVCFPLRRQGVDRKLAGMFGYDILRVEKSVT